MPVASYINGFNVGTDVSLTIADDIGDFFSGDQLGHLSGFTANADDVMAKVSPISNGGIPIFQTLWNGGSGTLEFVRVDGTFQKLFGTLAQSYHEAGVISQFNIGETVRNRDGSTDEFQFTGVQFSKPSFGNFRSTKEVDMRVSFMWSTMLASSASSSLLSALINAAR